MKIRFSVGCLIGMAINLSSPCFIQAEEYLYSIGFGLEFSSGRYGGEIRTDSVYAPLTVTVSPTDRLGFSLEVPLVYQSNGNVVSAIAKGDLRGSRTMMRPAPGAGGMPGSGSGTGAMAGPGGGGSGHGSGISSSTGQPEKGLGDITLKLGYLLLPERFSSPQLRTTVFVKFPTADEDRYLGTGEFDEGVAVEVSKWFGDWNPFAEAGYVLQGRSERFALKNYLAYNAGFGYQVSGNFRPLLLVKGGTSPAEGVGGLLEARVKLKYQTTRSIGMEGYLAKGLTTDSPDYGAGVTVYHDF